MKKLKKLKDIVKVLWAWYVLPLWWEFFPPKVQDPRSVVLPKDPGQTLDDE